MRKKAAAQRSEDDIGRLVTTFYARVRHDALLGPVFSAPSAKATPHGHGSSLAYAISGRP
jgi:truncated hemoglobin YjbI